MKFTLSWLFDHLDTGASNTSASNTSASNTSASNSGLDEICDMLNRIGLEVEEVTDPAARLAGFEVAEIVDTEPHPDADKLKICTVRSGSGTQKLVCGAPNARPGLTGILANEGAVIPANGMVLGKAKIRGVESSGMMCSAAELELSDDHDGIIELTGDYEIGTSAARALGLDDPVIEIAITPNRPDCLGVRGIARDLAAAGLGELKPDRVQAVKAEFDCPVKIELSGDACPAFAGQMVRGVKNGPSPDWLAARLTAIGLRPINALVDISNYISYDRGRPLHVYDAAKLSGTLIARNGKAGEKFTALDEQDYQVTADDCVIADDAQVLGFGGILGGMASGSTQATTDVLVESAWFKPVAIAYSGRRHGIDSDARYRFERGVDPQSVLPGLNLAVQMIVEICGGTASEVALAGTPPAGTKEMGFDPSRVKALTGIELGEKEIADILSRLGFSVDTKKSPWQVTVPSWRPDIDGAADLVEEVTRIFGMDNVPSVPLPRLQAMTPPILTLGQKRVGLARRVFAGRGLVEAVTWSFLPEDIAALFGGDPALKLANPISVELSNMRPGLLPGLLMATGRNIARGFANVGLFEVGQVFPGPGPGEQMMTAAALRRGRLAERNWSGADREVDLYTAKADAEALLLAYGVEATGLQVRREAPDWYHPGRLGMLCRDPRTPLAYFGALHPAICDRLDVDGPVVACEVFPEALPAPKVKPTRAKAVPVLSSLQAVRRDFAFEVDADVAAGDVIRAARGADKKLIVAVHLFDAFSGGVMAAGRKSLAIEVTLQPIEATLTDEEIEAVSSKIIAAVEKATSGTLRS